MPGLPARLPAPATVAHQIAGYWSGDHRSRRGDEDEQHCYSHSWRIALLERFWQARHPPRYAAYLTPSSPRFPHSSILCTQVLLFFRGCYTLRTQQVGAIVNSTGEKLAPGRLWSLWEMLSLKADAFYKATQNLRQTMSMI